MFLQADDAQVKAMIKKYPGPCSRPSSKVPAPDVQPHRTPLDKDTNKPAMILSADVNEPNADDSVDAIGRWYAGDAVTGFRAFHLSKSDDNWQHHRGEMSTNLLSNMSNKLRFGLPKGSLQDATIEKLAKAGYNIQVSSRSYVPYVDDEELEIRLIRAQEISRYVEHGYLDCGITGYDWIMENGSKVHEVGEFLFSKVSRRPARWVLCVPENSPVKSVKDLEGKRIATEVVNLTKKLSQEERRACRGGIFLGRHRSEGARTRGRHCGSHRNRLLAQGQQAAHRG